MWLNLKEKASTDILSVHTRPSFIYLNFFRSSNFLRSFAFPQRNAFCERRSAERSSAQYCVGFSFLALMTRRLWNKQTKATRFPEKEECCFVRHWDEAITIFCWTRTPMCLLCTGNKRVLANSYLGIQKKVRLNRTPHMTSFHGICLILCFFSVTFRIKFMRLFGCNFCVTQ